jgi:hypothetical protein
MWPLGPEVCFGMFSILYWVGVRWHADLKTRAKCWGFLNPEARSNSPSAPWQFVWSPWISTCQSILEKPLLPACLQRLGIYLGMMWFVSNGVLAHLNQTRVSEAIPALWRRALFPPEEALDTESSCGRLPRRLSQGCVPCARW